jgi:hypothetical protein
VVPLSWTLICGLWVLMGLEFVQTIQPPAATIDLSNCPSRVLTQQGPLFTSEIYLEQFNWTAWNASRIWKDKELCSSGFQGNSDIYGPGIRIGLYLQWLLSLIAKQFLRDTRIGLSQAYLIFSLAIFIAVMVMTASNECNFSVEVVMLHTMYFGDYFCVFYMPNLTGKGNVPEWQGMSWTRAVMFMLYAAMVGHGAWFWPYG